VSDPFKNKRNLKIKFENLIENLKSLFNLKLSLKEKKLNLKDL